MNWKMGLKAKEYFILAAVAAGVYVGFKYVSPLVMPFLFAFLFVTVLHPLLDRIQERIPIKKSFLTAGILLLLCVTVGALVWGLAVFLFHKAGELLSGLDLFEDKFYAFVGSCCDGIEKSFGVNGDGIETFIMERVNVFIENFQIQVVPKLMNRSFGYVKNIAGVIAFLAVTVIASVLLARDYPAIMEKLRGREELSLFLAIGKRIFHHVGTFLRAQLIILLVISILCAATLFFAKIEGGILLGLFTGFMDMLPFIGTGLILMPLAFWQILNGYYAKAAVCVVLYVVCAVTREFLEPKLIGERMGIFPVAILLSVYAGVKLFGVFGIVKGPLALITVYEIYRYRKMEREKSADR